MEDSTRIRKLRSEIIKTIPKFPNTRETIETLESMSLSTLLIHYLSWASRYISTKPRKVTIESSVTADPRWESTKHQINALLEKVRSGDNLTPHLSMQTHTRGYTPTASESGPDADRWADKDLLLNAMGYHHLHLGMRLDNKGHIERTNDVLFAQVTREKFIAIGIFDHTVFESRDHSMSLERERLWKIFDSRQPIPPGAMVMATPIATSGHPIHLVLTAQDYSRKIRKFESEINNSECIARLYNHIGTKPPKKPKLEWELNFSDLYIHEKNLNKFVLIGEGFN